jgi:hypothetical protein
MMRSFFHRTCYVALTLTAAGLIVIAAGMIGGATSLTASTEETSFLAENEAAMNNMMAAMTVKPSGSVDEDFVAMMVPHHQGAIDMAQAELRYGRNEQLRRLAQEIIVTQQQEIAAMRLAVGLALGPSVSSPGAAPLPHHSHSSGGPQ